MTSHLHSNFLDHYKYNEQINSKLLHICSEFFSFLNLNYFSYGFYEDQSHFSVVTNLDLSKYLLTNKIFSINSKLIQNQIINLPFHELRPFILNGDPKEYILKNAFNFNVWNNIIFLYRENSRVYWWNFGTNRENSGIVSEYMKKRILFEDFIKYFNQASSDIISHDDKLKIIHPNYQIPAYDSSYDESSQQFQAKLLRAINSYVDNKFYLTKREIECIEYLAQGKTAKEIAKLLNLSPRTIETYLQNARLRLNCPNKSRLIDFFKDYCS